MNLHTKILFKLIKKGMSTFEPTPPDDIPAPSVKANKKLDYKRVSYTSPNIIVPKTDEDVASRPFIARTIINVNNSFSPFRDYNTQWDSAESGQQSIQDVFGAYLPKNKVNWNDHDPTGDRALEWWAFGGFGALELKALSAQEASKEKAGDRIPQYVSSYEFLSDFEVRSNLARYGGNAYFDKAGKIIKIKLHGKDVFPHEVKSWEYAKFAYRTSSFVWTTIYHHLFKSHYNISNTPSIATYTNLDANHPLREFLKPFLFRTAAINNASCDTLLPKGSIIHRATGFTWDSMQEAYKVMLTSDKFMPFPDQIKQAGITDHLQNGGSNILGYANDGLAFWKVVHSFISDVVDNSPAFGKILKNDASKRWWEQVNVLSNNELGGFDSSGLISYLTEFVFTVSGYHSFVGHVSPFVRNPKIATGKLYPDVAMANQQASQQIAVVASITGLEMPSLLGNFNHLMPDVNTRESLLGFQNNLKVLNSEIEDRNAKRDIPLNAFVPDKMSLGVSI
ncbi:MAG: hypothetical protein ACI8VT_001844 [Saprospiraceae bacterium]|jgi:hypothetical protein